MFIFAIMLIYSLKSIFYSAFLSLKHSLLIINTYEHKILCLFAVSPRFHLIMNI